MLRRSFTPPMSCVSICLCIVHIPLLLCTVLPAHRWWRLSQQAQQRLAGCSSWKLSWQGGIPCGAAWAGCCRYGGQGLRASVFLLHLWLQNGHGCLQSCLSYISSMCHFARHFLKIHHGFGWFSLLGLAENQLSSVCIYVGQSPFAGLPAATAADRGGRTPRTCLGARPGA